MIKVKAHGKSQGTAWDECGKNQISHIFIAYNDKEICSIQFAYLVDGKSLLSDHFGGNGNNLATIKLDYPSEYLTSVSGVSSIFDETLEGLDYFDRRKHGTLGELSFGTNRRKYGPYATKIKEYYENCMGSFCFEMADTFYGFYGHYDCDYVHEIGVYVTPNSGLNPCNAPSSSTLTESIKSEEEDCII